MLAGTQTGVKAPITRERTHWAQVRNRGFRHGETDETEQVVAEREREDLERSHYATRMLRRQQIERWYQEATR